MTYYIYMITSPSGKSYVGQTKNFKDRMRGHRKDSKRKNFPICRAIRKYGWDSMKNKILIKCEEFDADYYEINCIRVYKTLTTENGYNLDSGGNKNKKHSEETKEKIGNAQKGEKNHNYGKHASDETRRKISKNNAHYWRGKNLSKETKLKLSEAQLGEKNHNYNKNYSEEEKLKIAISNGARLFQVFKDGQLIGEWINQHQCAIELNVYQQGVNACLHNRRRIHKGYTFRYK